MNDELSFDKILWNKAQCPDSSRFGLQGVHSDVGGSYPEAESGLSKITLSWMLRESAQAGLLLNDEDGGEYIGRLPGIRQAVRQRDDA